MKRERLANLAAVAIALAGVGLVVARAQDGPQPRPPVPSERGPEPGIWVTEVDLDPTTHEVQLLLNVGRDVGLARGDKVDIEREGKTIARASVVASYADVCIARVDEALDKSATVSRGDWVRTRGAVRPRPAPSAAANTVAGVKEGCATVDAGRNMGLHPGDEATVLRDGKPIARIRLDIVNDLQAGGPILEGDPHVGDRVTFVPAEHGHGTPGRDPLEPDLSREELRKLEHDADAHRGIDFAAVSFLGVVGELEHPVPIVAPCHVGVLVRRVIDGSPAERASIRAGDRVIAIDDRVVRTPAEIYRGVKRRAGDFVKVTLIRDDVIQIVSADFRKHY